MKSKITLTLLCTLFFSVLISCNSSTKSNLTPTSDSITSTVENTSSYTSKMTKSDKKKYYDNRNNVVYEVKYKPDGFKLRTESSTLILKVKLYNNKVKISDNEENLNPYEIKLSDTYNAKLVKNNETLAKTSYNLESKQQSVASETDAQPEFFKTSFSPSLLINKIPGIPTDQKQILIQELKAKGY